MIFQNAAAEPRRLELGQHLLMHIVLNLIPKSQILIFFKLHDCFKGKTMQSDVSQRGGFSPVVKFHWGGSATNQATWSIFTELAPGQFSL